MATILVVDDELSMREFLSILLEKDGHHVLTGSDGSRALAEGALGPMEAGIVHHGQDGKPERLIESRDAALIGDPLARIDARPFREDDEGTVGRDGGLGGSQHLA